MFNSKIFSGYNALVSYRFSDAEETFAALSVNHYARQIGLIPAVLASSLEAELAKTPPLDCLGR